MPEEVRSTQFPCRHCGAMLTFEPGTRALRCTYCGTLNEIAADDSPIEELDYVSQLRQLEQTESTHQETMVHCDGCGADSTLPPGESAGRCPFCGRAIVATAVVKSQIKPKSLLPFAVKKSRAEGEFSKWLAGLWLAPGGLKKYAEAGGLVGIYLPAWTYDATAITQYTGQRGEYYWTTESYTVVVNGRTQVQTRQVRRTRWYSASGVVTDYFDDLLILADRSLPADLRQKLVGWDLPALVPYADDYLSGFVAETYQVDLPSGFEMACELMIPTIRSSICGDIGGDEQQIDSTRTAHRDVTYKHVLLPVWISAYRYRGKSYHFAVNARTAMVFGQRPWSAWKITFLVLFILLCLFIVVLVANSR